MPTVTTTSPETDDPFAIDAPAPAEAGSSPFAPAVESEPLPPEPPPEPAPPRVESVARPSEGAAGSPTAGMDGNAVDSGFTPSQERTFNELLCIGTARPTAPSGLVEELREKIAAGTAATLERWPDRSLWFGKSNLTTASRCEGMIVANAAEGRPPGLHPATAVGIIAHRAIQISVTHPGKTAAEYVRESVRASRTEEAFSEFWSNAGDGAQSDAITSAISHLISFTDSFPPLDDRWHWRFEESVGAKVGSLTLGARVDLVLGRARADGRQTMVLADFKTSGLSEHHDLEAGFYALVAALRHGVPPWRSCVYSLSAGEWSEPDVTAERLHAVADAVIAGVCSHVEMLTEARDPVLTGGAWCRWCPARSTCPAAELT